jgi:hypothetical protein
VRNQPSDGNAAEREPQRNEANAREDPPLVIGSRKRGPDERASGLAPQEEFDKDARTTTAAESIRPAFTRFPGVTLVQGKCLGMAHLMLIRFSCRAERPSFTARPANTPEMIDDKVSERAVS